MEKIGILVIFVMISIVSSQSDGAFWWLNKKAKQDAPESRSFSDTNAKIRTLPPRYRKETEDTSTTTTTTARNSIFSSEEDEEDRQMFKYDNEPDCVCTPKYLCNENNTIVTDGNGVIDERSFSICGVNNVCCRVPKTTAATSTTTTTQRTTTTPPRRPILNLISTILKPVIQPSLTTTTTSAPAPKPVIQKCSSRKGNKIEKRILLGDDYDEDDDDSLVGETAFAEYPWMLEILKKNRKTGNFEYKCGGVLINPTTALTANHCVKGSNLKPADYLIRAGEWDRSNKLEFAPHHDRQLSRIIAHPNYYSGGLYNDIVILKWQQPLEAEVNVSPICLPDQNEVIEAGKYCTVTGWGKADEQTLTTDKLKFVKVPLVNQETCERQFQNNRLGKRFRLHESFVCAGGEEGLDSCKNDGGSPLICPRADGSYVLTGLVSWGLECGQKNVPGAYTNIKHLLPWIKSQEIN